MKNFLVSLLLVAPLVSTTNSIINIKTNHHQKSKAKKPYNCYKRMENVLLEMMDGTIYVNFDNLNADYQQILLDFNGAIIDIPPIQVPARIATIVKNWLNGLSFITIIPTDWTYLNGYLQYVYNVIPCYTMMPLIHADIIANMRNLPQIELDRLRQILTLMKNNDSTFGTSNNPLYGVDKFFKDNINIQKGYDPLLNKLTNTNPFTTFNYKIQYFAASWSYYGFYLYYSAPHSGEPMVKDIFYEGCPVSKKNYMIFK